MKKIVDVSGYGHSGKTAVSDFLKDYESVFSFPSYVEFELFRVQGGLLDLYLSIYFGWNLIRSRTRINEFKKLVLRIGTVQNKFKPSTLWNASGHGYNQFFNHKFISISEEFIEELSKVRQESFWPYDSLSDNKAKLFFDKIWSKLSGKLSLKTIYYTDRNHFTNLTSSYIHKLFSEVGDSNQTHVVLNNTFEPYNPSMSLEMVENSFSIVVDRDPRDIFSSLINAKDIFVPSFEKYKNAEELKKRMVGFDNIDQFIARFRILKDNIIEEQNNRVLRIRYEDFILNHEETVGQIKNHIGLTNLSKKGSKSFNIEDSKKNVGIWKQYKDLPEIIKIEKELAQYCYQQ
ncbi:sulfotransferase [Flavobacterium sp. JAS]|uniref:sulfotransferase n=1 Tax=Flavobacterium sp. JAS TaxID=2897329 RepID=UPI001E591F1C|nr:sulfotransferase [Flavobacterium sp. JAS]MCD0471057.1 sulfotransferase [Flavobacterium sp. JAS]